MEPTQTPAPAEPTEALKRVLLVEDDDALATVYVTRLQAEGFEVRRCSNGEEALATALSFKPDLALLDVMMPKVSGFDVLDILRNTPETAGLKVIMLTALSQESDKARAEALGANEYLVKSQVVISDVMDRVRHLINT
jgi:DNA-binding response OmpR family regulator